MAFLSVVTRHLPARGALLARNRASLAAQTDPDYEQTVLVDARRGGFARARALLIEAAPRLAGRYVLVLDDDDVMEAPDGIAALKAATASAPPAVIFRGRHAELGVLPRQTWRARPARGDIGSFDFILRADVFRAWVGARGSSDYAHDHALIEAVYDQHAAAVVWLDRVLCAADRRRIGGMDT